MHHTYYKYGVRLPSVVLDWQTVVRLFLRCSGKYRLHVTSTSRFRKCSVQLPIVEALDEGKLRTASEEWVLKS
jgi:hypothetical protein